MMTSTINLIQFQSNLKDHIEGEYNFLNTRNGTRIITKEVTDYSAMKSHLEKNNVHYFDLLPKFRKACKESKPSPSPGHARENYFQQP
jgi:hypothetical protein